VLVFINFLSLRQASAVTTNTPTPAGDPLDPQAAGSASAARTGRCRHAGAAGPSLVARCRVIGLFSGLSAAHFRGYCWPAAVDRADWPPRLLQPISR
jgi:hypothetical protein